MDLYSYRKRLLEQGIVQETLSERYRNPSLATLLELARQCNYLIDDTACDTVQEMRSCLGVDITISPVLEARFSTLSASASGFCVGLPSRSLATGLIIGIVQISPTGRAIAALLISPFTILISEPNTFAVNFLRYRLPVSFFDWKIDWIEHMPSATSIPQQCIVSPIQFVSTCAQLILIVPDDLVDYPGFGDILSKRSLIWCDLRRSKWTTMLPSSVSISRIKTRRFRRNSRNWAPAILSCTPLSSYP